MHVNWRIVVAIAAGYLLVGCAGSPPIPTVVSLPPTQTPTLPPVAETRTPLPTLTPSITLTPIAQVARSTDAATLMTAASSTPGTVAPTSTSALVAATRSGTITPLPTQASLLPGNAPPLTIKLPAGWKAGYSIVPIRQSLTASTMNLALYNGPVKSGQGTILVLWGFPSVGAPPTAIPPGPTATIAPGVTPLDYQSQLIWTASLQLLTGTVFDITCNTAQYGQRTFMVGGLSAVGTYFNASQCPSTPDTIGWFAALNQFGGNYMFVMYVDPSSSYNDSRGDLQAILDTVVFHAPVQATRAATSAATRSGPPPTNTPSSVGMTLPG